MCRWETREGSRTKSEVRFGSPFRGVQSRRSRGRFLRGSFPRRGRGGSFCPGRRRVQVHPFVLLLSSSSSLLSLSLSLRDRRYLRRVHSDLRRDVPDTGRSFLEDTKTEKERLGSRDTPTEANERRGVSVRGRPEGGIRTGNTEGPLREPLFGGPLWTEMVPVPREPLSAAGSRWALPPRTLGESGPPLHPPPESLVITPQ